MSYEAQQDREAQLAQIQNARTARLESLSPPSYSDYSLPGGVYVSAGCSQDPSCVSASMNEAEQNLQNPARAHPPLVGATSHVVPLAVPEWVEVAVEFAEAA